MSACLVVVAAAYGADAPDTVLARRGDVVITRGDWDAELLSIPANDRADFASNLRRNYTFIERMLTTRELALEAKRKKLDVDRAPRTRVRQEEDRILAAALIASAEEAAARDFEARQAVFERRARELYEVDRKKYATLETVMITVLFFSAEKDGREGAGRRADAALAKIRSGADIGDLVATVSDDATTRENRGRKGPLARTDLEATLAHAVFALNSEGAISDVIQTREGAWVVRLDERRASVGQSFNDVKGAILADLRQQQLAAARQATVDSAGAGKDIEFNAAAIEALRAQSQAGGAAPAKPAGS